MIARSAQRSQSRAKLEPRQDRLLEDERDGRSQFPSTSGTQRDYVVDETVDQVLLCLCLVRILTQIDPVVRAVPLLCMVTRSTRSCCAYVFEVWSERQEGTL